MNRVRAYIRDIQSSLHEENLTLPARAGSPSNASSSSFLTIDDGLILADSSAGDLLLTLPKVQNSGIMITIKKIDGSSNFVNVTGNGSELIDNAPTASIGQQYESVTFVEDGTGWWII